MASDKLAVCRDDDSISFKFFNLHTSRMSNLKFRVHSSIFIPLHSHLFTMRSWIRQSFISLIFHISQLKYEMDDSTRDATSPLHTSVVIIFISWTKRTHLYGCFYGSASALALCMFIVHRSVCSPFLQLLHIQRVHALSRRLLSPSRI